MDNVIIAVRWISTVCCLLLSLFILFTFIKPIKTWLSKKLNIIPSKNRSTKIYFVACALLFIAVAIFNFILKDLYIIVGCAFVICAIILILRALLPNGVYEEGIITDFKSYKWSDIAEVSWSENKLSIKDKKGSPEALIFDAFKIDDAYALVEKKADENGITSLDENSDEPDDVSVPDDTDIADDDTNNDVDNNTDNNIND